LWLILLVVAVVLCCLLLTYALGKAVIHPKSDPNSLEKSPPV
jgi:hypothetical protein